MIKKYFFICILAVSLFSFPVKQAKAVQYYHFLTESPQFHFRDYVGLYKYQYQKFAAKYVHLMTKAYSGNDGAKKRNLAIIKSLIIADLWAVENGFDQFNQLTIKQKQNFANQYTRLRNLVFVLLTIAELDPEVNDAFHKRLFDSPETEKLFEQTVKAVSNNNKDWYKKIRLEDYSDFRAVIVNNTMSFLVKFDFEAYSK